MVGAIRVFGVFLLLVGACVPLWWLTTRSEQKTKGGKAAVVTVGTIAMLAGLACIMEDRVTELTISGVGTIKSVTEQAIADAADVAKLKERVENQSATVDLIAKQTATTQELSENVQAQEKQGQERLEALDKAIGLAQMALVKVGTQESQAQDRLDILNGEIAKAKESERLLQQEETFTMTVVAAQNDDRTSFDKLRELATLKDYPFANMAVAAWITIYEAHSSQISQSGFSLPWASGVDPAKLAFGDLSAAYQSTPAQFKPGLLEYIWNRSDIPTVDRLDFMMVVMKSDHSLMAVEYAGRYFTSGTNQRIKPMALDYLTAWWDAHRQEYLGK
jgi:hypothetical protein